ncbi:MAG: hypothetical protein QM767_01790 [Anaeromyxobacter sp.]
MYHLTIPDSVVVRSAAGKVFVPNVDYKFNATWSQIVNVGNRLGTPDVTPVKISFDSVLQRLDLIQVLPNGTLSIKKGTPAATVPKLPAADPGAFALAGIHISPLDGAKRSGYALKARDIYPIAPAAPVARVNPQAVNGTLQKLLRASRSTSPTSATA